MTSRSYPLRRTALAAAVLGPVAVGACRKETAPPPPPPAEVSVVTVRPTTVEDDVVFTGQVQAFRTVQVRARIGVVYQLCAALPALGLLTALLPTIERPAHH